MKKIIFCLLAALFAAGSFSTEIANATEPLTTAAPAGISGAGTEKNMNENQIVERVDHILLMPGAKNARALFDFFSGDLGLPVAWPYKSFGEFASGAVYFGNVSVEIIQMDGKIDGGSKIAGIAFEPSVKTEAVISALKNKKIPYEGPVPFEINMGTSKKNLWTSTYLKDILPGSQVFFCEYHMINPPDERKKLNDKFAACGGGSLKIKKIREIVIAHKNLASSVPKWNELAGPAAANAEFRLAFKEGPAIKFIAGKNDSIISLIVEADSPDKIEQVLKEKKLAGTKTEHGIELNKEKTFGVEIIIE